MLWPGTSNSSRYHFFHGLENLLQKTTTSTSIFNGLLVLTVAMFTIHLLLAPRTHSITLMIALFVEWASLDFLSRLVASIHNYTHVWTFDVPALVGPRKTYGRKFRRLCHGLLHPSHAFRSHLNLGRSEMLSTLTALMIGYYIIFQDYLEIHLSTYSY